jgi:hypothetical protein
MELWVAMAGFSVISHSSEYCHMEWFIGYFNTQLVTTPHMSLVHTHIQCLSLSLLSSFTTFTSLLVTAWRVRRYPSSGVPLQSLCLSHSNSRMTRQSSTSSQRQLLVSWSWSHVTTDGRSVSMSWQSWYRAPLLELRPDITSCRNVAVWNLRSCSCGAPSLTIGGSVICSIITQWSESLRTSNHTLLSHLRLPQPGGPGSRIHIPQEQGGPVISPGIGFPLRRLLRLQLLLFM